MYQGGDKALQASCVGFDSLAFHQTTLGRPSDLRLVSLLVF